MAFHWASSSRAMAHQKNPSVLTQFAPDGRDLSDATHPLYDPSKDPELRLRITHTANDSIHEAIIEDDRRRIRRKGLRRLTIRHKDSSLSEGVTRSRSIFGRKKSNASTIRKMTISSPTIRHPLENVNEDDNDDEDYMIRPVEQEDIVKRTQENAAFEAAESARRQANTDSTAQVQEERKRKKQGFFAFLSKSDAQDDQERRIVYVNIEDADNVAPRLYARNKVRTSKYTILSFVPKNLAEQFRRIANIYFLLLIILQVFPIFGASTPQVAMLPLLAILAITAIKDGIEDFRRNKLDNEVNNSAVTRLSEWKNVNKPILKAHWWQLGAFGDANRERRAQDSRGVKKLREREGKYDVGFLYSGSDHLDEDERQETLAPAARASYANTQSGQFDSIIDDYFGDEYTKTGIHANHSDVALLREAGLSTSSLHVQEIRPVRVDRGGLLFSDDVSGSTDELSRSQTPAANSTDEFLGREHPPSTDSSASHDSSTVVFEPPEGRRRAQTLENYINNKSQRSSLTNLKEQPAAVVNYANPAPGSARWERTLWKKVEVGDIVLLKEDDQIPADIVVLATSDADGVCFVETKNLDGETNLKPRRACKATKEIASEEDLAHARFWVESEAPHANLYAFNGVLKYRDGEEVHQEALTINELLLRGCSLRNTRWVIGLVLFTGADSKIMLNQGETPSKRSRIEKETNFNVLVNFVLLVIMCVVCAIAEGFFEAKDNTSAFFYEIGADISSSTVLDAVITLGVTLILFQNIVPISLVITVELVKTIQAFFIFQDIAMYYEPLDHPCVPKTWNISDDLGQIEYIFSDKTGTLTQNVMEFQKCGVRGKAYGEGITEAMMGAAMREGKAGTDGAATPAQIAEMRTDMLRMLKASFTNAYLQEDRVTLVSPDLVYDLVPVPEILRTLPPAQQHAQRQQAKALLDFWTAIALCHTALADRDGSCIEYKAESPDEAALVAAARDLGFVFISRTSKVIHVEIMGRPEKYIPLRTLEFNSSRKRMSSIVRTPDNQILLICKGADSVIYQRLRADHDAALIEGTSKNLEDFANAGLRTLCIASRPLTEAEYAKWVKIYDAACAASENREDEIENACELIEKDLVLLGATALEDKLQEGVPDAIKQLHNAGIKLWILTGDKLQTAIEIGFSCNLLTSAMDIMILSAESEAGARVQIESALEKITRHKAGEEEVAQLGQDTATAAPPSPRSPTTLRSLKHAVVIDGETLRYALSDSLKPAFLALTIQCDTVVCCRVSPAQKALTVKLVKDGCRAMTLAIGDGANDVAMIQEANIGVGIAGLEGAQASMSADYAVGQFRFLTRLLLVHGRWCYIRIADMHATFFYKNIVWTLTLFWYQIHCNFNGTYLYEYTLIMLFNLIFTSLPVAVLGIFDQDVSAHMSQAYPQLYVSGIRGLEWTRPKFFFFMLDGFYQSLISFYIPYLVYMSTATQSSNAHDFSVWELGTTVAVCAVTAANLFVGLHIRYWTWMVFVVIIGSTLAIHVWIAIYSQFQTYFFTYELQYLYSTFNFYTSVVLVQVLAIGPKFLYKYVLTAYFPKDVDIIREIQVYGLPESKKGGV